jgi:hypothetical protein
MQDVALDAVVPITRRLGIAERPLHSVYDFPELFWTSAAAQPQIGDPEQCEREQLSLVFVGEFDGTASFEIGKLSVSDFEIGMGVTEHRRKERIRCTLGGVFPDPA